MTEVVISGIGGTFPNSINVTEFREKLYSGINLVSDDNPRWREGALGGVPTVIGQIAPDIPFDNGIFSINSKLGEFTDPNYKRSLESALCAFTDAGMNLNDISGSRTSSIGGLSVNSFELLNHDYIYPWRLVGTSRTMQSNRVSFGFNLKGCSFSMHSSFDGVIRAMDYSKQMIQAGKTDAAIVVFSNMTAIPEDSYPFFRQGALCDDGATKSFSDNADGYARSEGTLAFFLQKKEDAYRSYGTILGISCYYKGSKDVYFEEMAKGTMAPILRDLYAECNVEPSQVTFVECAGLASKVKDAEELNSLDEVIMPRKENPLLVGSVKSNVGHTEGLADGMSILKALLTLDSGIIPPNLHYTSPNTGVPALLDGRIKVVTEKTPLDGNIVGVNAFCATNTFRHIVLKQHPKTNTYNPQVGVLPPDGVPRLFYMSGRSVEKTKIAIEKVEKMPIDPNFLGLAQNVFKKENKFHVVRGYTVLNDQGVENREIQSYNRVKPPSVWWVFTGMGSQWNEMGRDLLRLPLFAESIRKCHDILKPKGLDLYDIITSKDERMFDNILHSFVAIAAIQIGLVDVLREIGVVPDGLIGHSVGETACAYADGCLTAEETILAAYARGKASNEAPLIGGMMAAVGKGYKDIKNMVPSLIDVACHNSRESSTISGPAGAVNKFVEELKAKDIFVKAVNVSNIAYHSRYIQPAGPYLMNNLKEILKTPALRSSKWISTSVPKEKWDSDEGKYCSAEYLTNNLLSSVLFEEGSAFIPKDAIIVEVSPHGLLQAILKRSFPLAAHVPLTNRSCKDNLVYLLGAFGKLYNRGLSLDIEKLYPPVEFPVPRGTASLDFLVNWEGTVTDFMNAAEAHNEGKKQVINIRDLDLDFKDSWKHLKDYSLNGTRVVPLSLYIALITQLKENNLRKGDIMRVVSIRNIRINRLLQVQNDVAKVSFSYGPGTGNLQIDGQEEPIANLNITDNFEMPNLPPLAVSGEVTYGSAIYDFLSKEGLDLGPDFKLIKAYEENESAIKAEITWKGQLANFIEAMLLLPVYNSRGEMNMPIVTSIVSVKIDLEKFTSTDEKDITVYYSKPANAIYCEGLEINRPFLEDSTFNRSTETKLQKPKLLPYSVKGTLDDFIIHIKRILFGNILNGTSGSNELIIYEYFESVKLKAELEDVFQNKSGIKVFCKLIEGDKDLAEETVEGFATVLIIAGSLPFPNGLQVLENHRNSYILLKNVNAPAHLSVITDLRIGKDVYSFCKYGIMNAKSTPQINTSSPNWESNLKQELSGKRDNVYLIFDDILPSQIMHSLQKCSKFHQSYKIRYVFHDEKGSFKMENHMNHLKKGLPINILQKSKWFSLTLEIMWFNSLPKDVVCRVAFKLSSISAPGLDIKAIGLSTKDFNTQNISIEVVEYSGVTEGREVCGLAVLDEQTRTLKPDPIFRWDLPSGWSHESIAAALLPYLFAYSATELTYSLRDKINALKKEPMGILCLNGISPLSQAFVSSSPPNPLLFVTYNDEHEKQILKNLYPQIPERNIICGTSTKDMIEELKRKCPTNFRLIFNPIPDEQLCKSTFRLLAPVSEYIQLAFKGNSTESIGMFPFIGTRAVLGISTLGILSLSNSIKEVIREQMQSALSESRIKPIAYSILSNDTLNYDVVEMLRAKEYSFKRMIISQSQTRQVSRRRWFLAAKEDSVIFIVNENSGKFFRLLYWFLNRNVQDIHLFINEDSLMPFITNRLNILKSRKPKLSIQVTPSNEINTAEKLKRRIKQIKSSSHLTVVTILGQEIPEKLKAIIDTLKSTRIIYLSPKLDGAMTREINNGIQVIHPEQKSVLEVLLPVMDELLTSQENTLIMKDCEEINFVEVDDFLRTYVEFLPCSVEEICALRSALRARRTAGRWKEVRTISPRYEKCPSIPPIFVVPSLKKGAMDKLYSHLIHPVFVAQTPIGISQEDFLDSLTQDARRFNLNSFTLVCDGLCWKTGLNLAKKLERDGKYVTLLVLDAPLDLNHVDIHQAVKHKVEGEYRRETVCAPLKDRIESGLSILKEHIRFISDNPETQSKDKLFSGFFVLIRHTTKNSRHLEDMQKNCENPISILLTEETSYLSMLKNKKVADVINSVVQMDRRDTAKKWEQNRSLINTHYELLENKDKYCFGLDVLDISSRALHLRG